MDSKGRKFDTDKPRWDLVPISEFEDIVKALTTGAKKYDDNNWQRVENATERYYAALMRHLCAWRKDEGSDPETGESHLAHAGACLLFLMWHDSIRKFSEE